jgi:prepilin-type N-terminal cleavage/methylation domain-containing protein
MTARVMLGSARVAGSTVPPHAERSEGSCAAGSNPRRQERHCEQCRARATSARGFTLVELLVALAIFLTIMSVVALFFTSAIRTSKQGLQNQQAFETARGAMRLLERDLSRAFTNRDHGDVYSFYGTPIGFTYVGMVNVDDIGEYNLARVTYVIYHDSLNTLNGAVAEYENVDGNIVPTYNILRVIEPGVDNLDAYRIPWTSAATGESATFEQMVQGIAGQVGCSPEDTSCLEVATRTARREIWIRMLAGGGETIDADTDNDGFPDATVRVPSAWTELTQFANVVPEDFVVAENIRYLRADGFQCGADQDELQQLLEAAGTPLDYDDRIFGNANGDYCARIITDADRTPIFDPFNPIGPPVAVVPDPNSGEQPFFTYWDMGIRGNNPNTEADDKVDPIAFQFWNDVRNIMADGIDNDDDLNEPGGGIDEPDEFQALTVGSPLDARLPLAVTVDFTLFFKSPYLGAPDFNQRFTQRIDLPTGYRRSLKTNVTGP